VLGQLDAKGGDHSERGQLHGNVLAFIDPGEELGGVGEVEL
jgi:hypothetical protein